MKIKLSESLKIPLEGTDITFIFTNSSLSTSLKLATKSNLRKLTISSSFPVKLKSLTTGGSLTKRI